MVASTQRRAGRAGSKNRSTRWIVICIGLAVSGTGTLGMSAPQASEYRIETFAGTGQPGDIPHAGGHAREIPFALPFGVEYGPDGGLFVTCVGTHRVLRIDPQSGQTSPVAGNGQRGYAGDGGAAPEAMLNEPYEVRFDSRGNLIIVEMKNHLIRKVDVRTGTISTLAGDGVAGFQGDSGPALQARFRDPHSLAIDAHDNIYVSDLANNRVRRVDAETGQITTLIGDGQEKLPTSGELAREQPFLTPQGLVVRNHNLWIASVSGHSLWRLDLETGRIHRVAGTGRPGHSGDGGDPLAATFDGPRGMTMSADGILYVAEGENNVIRAIDTVQGSIRTIAGVGREHHHYGGDGIPATRAPLWQPHGVCVGLDGGLLVSDTKNHRVRLLVPIGD
jgi:DNA-binding beta-propeller fold protein YncE